MNIFLVGWHARGSVDLEGAEAVLRGLANELSLEPGEIKTWRSPSGALAAAALIHPREQVPTSYVHREESKLALFAGRPIRWTSTGEAEGREPLDARFYLAPAAEWMDALDGRCTALRYDDSAGCLEVYSDRLGAYPLYSASGDDGTYWLANKPALLAELVGQKGLNLRALASFFTCGWGFGGETLWNGIDRLPRASLHRFTRDGAHEVIQLLPLETIGSYFGAGCEAKESAKTLVEIVRATADWPGRSLRVQLSGGRDSRLVFAAAVAAGVAFEVSTIAFPNTPGYPDTIDVTIARRLAAASGHAHSVAPRAQGLGVRRSARLLRLLSNGLVSIGTTGPLTPPDRTRPLPLIHSGQGGEIARAYYGIGVDSAAKIATGIYRHIVPPLPRPIVTREAQKMVRSYVDNWVHEQIDGGIAPVDVPDTFYLLEKMSNWAGPSHGVYEWTSDVISPVWTARVLPHAVGLPPEQRERELFHLQILETLSPELARIPFDSVNPRWPAFPARRSGRVQRYRVLAFKIAQELRRRASARRSRDADAVDPFLAEVLRETREYALASPSHPAWDVLDRRRLLRLLSQTPATLDPRSRRYLLGLATIFAAEDDG